MIALVNLNGEERTAIFMIWPVPEALIRPTVVLKLSTFTKKNKSAKATNVNVKQVTIDATKNVTLILADMMAVIADWVLILGSIAMLRQGTYIFFKLKGLILSTKY